MKQVTPFLLKVFANSAMLTGFCVFWSMVLHTQNTWAIVIAGISTGLGVLFVFN